MGRRIAGVGQRLTPPGRRRTEDPTRRNFISLREVVLADGSASGASEHPFRSAVSGALVREADCAAKWPQ